MYFACELGDFCLTHEGRLLPSAYVEHSFQGIENCKLKLPVTKAVRQI